MQHADHRVAQDRHDGRPVSLANQAAILPQRHPTQRAPVDIVEAILDLPYALQFDIRLLEDASVTIMRIHVTR